MEGTGQKGKIVRNGMNLDRRQRKTRRAIYEAFEDLMSTEHYQQVTVAQIIERADIGRSTFYAHFETKDDLLQDMCQDMFDHIFEGVNELCETHAGLETADLAGKLAHLLYHLRDTHKGVCGKLVKEGEPHFTAYFDQQLSVLIEREAPASPAGVPLRLAVEVRVAAFLRTVSWWFENGATDTPEDLAHWFCTVMGI